MSDDMLDWQQIREGASSVPVDIDADTGQPIQTLTVTPGQPRVWPYVVGLVVLFWWLSRHH